MGSSASQSSGRSMPLVLVSDDEPHVGAAWARRGRQLGFAVMTDTTSNVVALAREHLPAVIILDLNQTVNGLELLHMLKRDPVTSAIPVMIVTSVDEEWVKEVSGEFGALEFVLKPVDDQLMHRVASLARSRSPAATIRGN
jgi:two-component system, OmpR family, response regulator AdeR